MKTLPDNLGKVRVMSENARFWKNLRKKMDENEHFFKIGQRSIVQ